MTSAEMKPPGAIPGDCDQARESVHQKAKPSPRRRQQIVPGVGRRPGSDVAKGPPGWHGKESLASSHSVLGVSGQGFANAEQTIGSRHGRDSGAKSASTLQPDNSGERPEAEPPSRCDRDAYRVRKERANESATIPQSHGRVVAKFLRNH